MRPYSRANAWFDGVADGFIIGLAIGFAMAIFVFYLYYRSSPGLAAPVLLWLFLCSLGLALGIVMAVRDLRKLSTRP